MKNEMNLKMNDVSEPMNHERCTNHISCIKIINCTMFKIHLKFEVV